MKIILVMSVPMAILWMIFARQFSLEGLVVGYILGFGVLFIIRINTTFEEDDEPIQLRKIPFQLLALIWYIIRLSIDVVFSGIDVGKRVINPKLPIDPGVHTISTQDAKNSGLVSALSAHSITITPGELVIDYETDENGQTLMLVHCLDKERSNIDKLNTDQRNRLKLIRQILGHDPAKDE
jgi:multicomponent Na+:H+ antiporter subunit E